MYVRVVGGGPGGLTFACLLKQRAPDVEVVVSDRQGARPEGGFGVVLSDATLGSLREGAPRLYGALEPALVRWDMLEVVRGGRRTATRGQPYVAISRRAMLTALADACEDAGVVLKTEEVGRVDAGDADLVVAADGITSTVREELSAQFGVRRRVHRPRFAWFGTTRPFGCLTFVVEDTPAGLFQAHAYPFDGETSTFVVQCSEDTWRAAGLAEADGARSLDICQEVFAPTLEGRLLLDRDSRWRQFVSLRCDRLWVGNVALVGDAAHTVHWSIGSGTKVAIEDAVALAEAVAGQATVADALVQYELARRLPVERLQRAAVRSAEYFDELDRYRQQPAAMFAFGLLTRSGRMDYAAVRSRDPAYADEYDRWFAAQAGAPRSLVPPPPGLAPLRLGAARLDNRMAVRVPAAGTDAYDEAVRAAAAGRPGLLVLDRAAVAADGRYDDQGLALFAPEHAALWSRWVAAARAAGAECVAVELDHAGPRAGRRCAGDGRLVAGSPPGLAPSSVPFGRRLPASRAAEAADLAAVVDHFAASAALAHQAGADVLLVNMALGGLLATFLSPLTNRRHDDYGGSEARRAAFPLLVFEAVRQAWPDRPLGAVVSADDGVRGGCDLRSATALARALADRGCELLAVEAGQGTDDALVWSDQDELYRYADVLRHTTSLVVLAGGTALSSDEVHTSVAAGRADLCQVVAAPGAEGRSWT